jgi:hypothetical protein
VVISKFLPPPSITTDTSSVIGLTSTVSDMFCVKLPPAPLLVSVALKVKRINIVVVNYWHFEDKYLVHCLLLDLLIDDSFLYFYDESILFIKILLIFTYNFISKYK